ncbi:hypothetical protein MRBLWO14_002412 [Microbacterium sp. LWO14-1.2]|uniref:nucleotidyltransferase domain-containing protein n=1 Tax=Microbacterium sp. LWO14-1.2 TaxID=3135263 RepID=UPI0031394333
MADSTPHSDAPWRPLAAGEIVDLLSAAGIRWWLSGGVALDRWVGREIRKRGDVDISVIRDDLPALVRALPDRFSAWAAIGDDCDHLLFRDVPEDADVHRVKILNDSSTEWVLQVNVEDGGERAWVYKRDPRLQLPWDRAVRDIGGVPTGAPEVQLVWKALRPRPEDDVDKDAVLAALDPDARAWYEQAILSIHPHSTWSIHVRSPFAPTKASWGRKRQP